MFNKFINRYTCSPSQLSSIIFRLNQNNMYPIIDYINERGNDHYSNYKKIIENINKYPHNFFSIKLSSLNIKNDYKLSEKYAQDICLTALENNCCILIDAEDYNIQDQINTITNDLMYKYNIDKTNIYKTYQCYRKDSFETIKNDLYLKDVHNYNLGIKLVRGAYYNSDKKYNILFNTIDDTHNNYNKIVKYLFQHTDHNDRIMIASHNSKSCDLAINNKHLLKNEDMLCFAQLLGMGDELSNKLSKTNIVYKYVPFGNLYESIPYLLRRLYENKDSIKYLYK